MNNLDTISKLVEFGLELSIAKQMIGSMNQTMQTVNVPVGAYPAKITEKLWYVGIDGQTLGPFSEAELARKLFKKEISKDTLVWCSGMPKWEVAQNVPEVLKLIIQTPPSL